MKGGQSWAHEVLASAADPGPPDPVLLERAGPSQWASLFDASSAHGMTGWLARRLRPAPSVPQEWQLKLQGAALAIGQNHSRRLADARSALALLGANVLVLKGPALVERYYKDPTLRPYGDVDLYVLPGDFRRAVHELENEGYHLKDRNWDFIAGDMRGQLHFTAPSGGVIELHWHVVNSGRQRKTLGMASDELLRDATRSELGGQACLALQPADEVAHLCLHAALHGCNRLIWLLDIRMLAETVQIDWDAMARRLHRWRFGPGGYLVLSLAAALTETAVPLDDLRPLRPRGFTRRAFARLVDTWDLGDVARGAQVRELFFATAADGFGARMGLATDVIVPSVGQRNDRRETGRRHALLRVTLGSVDRVRSKLRGEVSDFAEYRAQGEDPETGRKRFFDAVDSGAQSTPG